MNCNKLVEGFYDTVNVSEHILKAETEQKNKYYGKQFSVLGDSVSTLAGYNPKGYKAFYDGENCEKSGVKEMKDTWWGKAIDFFGGELLVNNSYSGSRVTVLPGSGTVFPSGCSDARTGRLHIRDIKPDVIIIYLGTNDWAFGVELDGTHFLIDIANLQYFAVAYETMLEKIKTNYPDAEIWCCTLNTTVMSSNPSFKFPYEYGGTHIEKYNQIIKDTADMHNCKVIDLYSYHIPYDSIDGTHPNADGMNILASLMIREIGGKEAAQFMDCVHNQPEHCIAKQCSEGAKYICKKCRKMDSQSNCYDAFEESNGMGCDVLKAEIRSNQPQDISVGTVIDGKYELLKLIGEKGIFQVYLALDKRVNTYWTIKICHDDLYHHTDSAKNRIIQEAQMLGGLEHPAISRIVDIMNTSECFAVVTDYIQGETLEDIVKNFGAQPVEKVVDWAKQICSVLGYLHSLNPPHIYRAMKPENVILQPNGNIKIINFSDMLSYNLEEQSVCAPLETRGYVAPEQYGGRDRTDARTDIYGLGMTMYRLITGVDPTQTPYEVTPICRINPNLPKGLEYIICKCIQVNPKDRYPSCAVLMDDLNKYQRLPNKKSLFLRLFNK